MSLPNKYEKQFLFLEKYWNLLKNRITQNSILLWKTEIFINWRTCVRKLPTTTLIKTQPLSIFAFKNFFAQGTKTLKFVQYDSGRPLKIQTSAMKTSEVDEKYLTRSLISSHALAADWIGGIPRPAFPFPPPSTAPTTPSCLPSHLMDQSLHFGVVCWPSGSFWRKPLRSELFTSWQTYWHNEKLTGGEWKTTCNVWELSDE